MRLVNWPIIQIEFPAVCHTRRLMAVHRIFLLRAILTTNVKVHWLTLVILRWLRHALGITITLNHIKISFIIGFFLRVDTWTLIQGEVFLALLTNLNLTVAKIYTARLTRVLLWAFLIHCRNKTALDWAVLAFNHAAQVNGSRKVLLGMVYLGIWIHNWAKGQAVEAGFHLLGAFEFTLKPLNAVYKVDICSMPKLLSQIIFLAIFTSFFTRRIAFIFWTVCVFSTNNLL